MPSQKTIDALAEIRGRKDHAPARGTKRAAAPPAAEWAPDNEGIDEHNKQCELGGEWRPQRTRLIQGDSAYRKQFPIGTGVLDYFPDAIAEVARISKAGNDKHNPGEPIHWSRGKSMDHADCIIRHFEERGGFDPEGNRHSGQLAWRALALLQEELEEAYGLATPRGALPSR